MHPVAGREVQLGDLRRLEVDGQARSSGVTVDAGPLRERVAERPEPVVEEGVGEPQVRRQVGRERGTLAVGAGEPADELDAVRRHLPQVRVVPAAVPGQVRRCRRSLSRGSGSWSTVGSGVPSSGRASTSWRIHQKKS